MKENKALKTRLKALAMQVEERNEEISSLQHRVHQLETSIGTFVRKFMERFPRAAISLRNRDEEPEYKNAKRPTTGKAHNGCKSILEFRDMLKYVDRVSPDKKSLLIDGKGRTNIIGMDERGFCELLTNNHAEYLDIMSQSSDMFRVIASVIPDCELEAAIKYMRTLTHDSRLMVEFTHKLVHLIRGLQHLNVFLTADESIDYLVDVVCPLVDCDRASVFLLDEATGELWSKKAKGAAETIRVPWNSGIVGAVVTSGKMVNIEDAYEDPRFNRSVDLKTNYRTKTILCVPLRDRKGKIVGTGFRA